MKGYHVKNYTRLARLTALAITFLSIFSAQLVSAQSGSIGGRPANPEPGNDRTKSIFIATLKPGQSKADAVEVVNNTGETKEILLYSVDAVPSSGGAFACAQAVDAPQNVGKWIVLDQTSLTLPPNEKATVDFTINAPATASPGEQNGCIVLQEKKASSFQGGIGLSFRTAIRVAVLVPGTIVKELTPTGIAVAKNKGMIVITPSVKNTGNVSLDTTVNTKMYSILGTTVAKQSNTFPVLRDQPTQWNFEFKRPFWGGIYRASYSLAYDQSKTGYLGSVSKNNKDLTVVNGPSSWLISAPQPLATAIELLLLVLLITGFAYVIKSRRHKKRVATSWVTYTVNGNEQLQDIARDKGVSWKKLAATNKLKAPYHLTAGQQIKVPGATKSTRKSPPKKT